MVHTDPAGAAGLETPKAELGATAAPVLTLADVARLGGEALLTQPEVARVLRTSEKTIQRWRSTGAGPRWGRIGPRRIAYKASAVLAYAGEPAQNAQPAA